MASSLMRTVGVWCACAMAAGVLAQERVPEQPDTVLVHRFKIPNGEAWGAVVVGLSSGGWHVGAADGRSASTEQLRIALRDLVGIEIGARCAGWADGPTVYPCGFSFRNIDLAGAVLLRHAAIAMDWNALNAARDTTTAGLRPDQHASDVATTPRIDAQRFVALRLPPAYLGDKGASLGGRLSFEVRTVTNVQAPARFDRSSGLVVLRARPRGDPS